MNHEELLDHLIDEHGRLRCGWSAVTYAELGDEHERDHREKNETLITDFGHFTRHGPNEPAR